MAANLVDLNLSYNNIAELPENFGELLRLLTLNLSHNELVKLPEDRIDILASLLTLDVSNNHINAVPTDMPYLYRIKVEKNRETDIF